MGPKFSSFYSTLFLEKILIPDIYLFSVNKQIIERYRPKENLETLNAKNPRSKIPTPLEFSLHVIDEAAKIGVENLNPHWQSQWGCCPFCTLDFDIIGHLETFGQDMKVIIKAMNWQVCFFYIKKFFREINFTNFFS